MTAPAPVLLVTGADGQVGWELLRSLAPLGRVVAWRRRDADLTDTGRLRDMVRGLRPAAIVNAAAYTAVDLAESEPDLAFAVNARAPGLLAEEAARLGALMVHYSTDYVFDGEKRSPYTERDPVAPLSVYGASKLTGERAVAAAGARHLVLRTSWVYGSRGRNFMRTMLRLARERDELRVVDDQLGSPTPARLIAQVTAIALARHAAGGGFHVPEALTGVHHVTTRGTTTWHGFARAILSGDPRRDAHRVRLVTPITSADFPTPARRPGYSVLDVSRFERSFEVVMPEWEPQLESVIAELDA